MKNTNFRSVKAFQKTPIHRYREPGGLSYLKRKTSFWVASLSLFAFVAGNMVGQHGWYAFWASVMGAADDTAIVYTGTVSPVKQIVDYTCWSKYGGDFKVNTFRQAPEKCLTSPPTYVSGGHDPMISMEYMSSYVSGVEGTGLHTGIDYRVPVGTPIESVMNGRVFKTVQSSADYGMYVVIKHPNAPDPSNPTRKTLTLYSTYAHLSAILVTEGQTIQKGDDIALSGETGNVTGPHLHFQMDRDTAPFIPYSADSIQDGYAYTVSPMLYVQENFQAIGNAVIAQHISSSSVSLASVSSSSASSVQSSVSSVRRVIAKDVKSMVAILRTMRDERAQQRASEIRSRQVIASRFQVGLLPAAPSAPAPDTFVTTTSVRADSVTETAANGQVAIVRFVHDGFFTGRGWEKVRVTLEDADGNTVTHPNLPSDLKLVAAYGTADFRPQTLSVLDFSNGSAEIFALPRGRRTVIIQVLPFSDVSQPMVYRE